MSWKLINTFLPLIKHLNLQIVEVQPVHVPLSLTFTSKHSLGKVLSLHDICYMGTSVGPHIYIRYSKDVHLHSVLWLQMVMNTVKKHTHTQRNTAMLRGNHD